MKLGSPVTGVQLSPSQDLLATTHVKRRGIYLWYNHLMFGSGADIQPSTRPVNAALPSIATGEPLSEWLLCWNHPVTTCDVPPCTCSGTVQVEVRCLCVWQHAVLFGVSTDSNIRHCCKDSTESRAVLPCMQLHACGLDKANLAGNFPPVLLFALHSSGDQEQRVESQDSNGTAQSLSHDSDVVIAQATQILICPMGDT